MTCNNQFPSSSVFALFVRHSGTLLRDWINTRAASSQLKCLIWGLNLDNCPASLHHQSQSSWQCLIFIGWRCAGFVCTAETEWRIQMLQEISAHMAENFCTGPKPRLAHYKISLNNKSSSVMSAIGTYACIMLKSRGFP